MRHRKFETAWYAHGFLRELVLIYPTYAIMMQQGGISAIELSALFIFWSTSAFVFEVPSGVLADRMSRRNLLAISGVVKGCAFLIWWLTPGFLGYACGFLVWSLGSSLGSGTAEALLHDTLAADDNAREFERIYGRGEAAGSLGVVAALVTGGWLAESGFELPLLLSAVAPCLAAATVFLFISEPPRTAHQVEEPFFATLSAGAREVLDNRTLLVIAAMIATLPVLWGAMEEYVNPLLAERQTFSLTEIGLISAFAFGMRVLGLTNAHRFKARGVPGVLRIFMTSGVLMLFIPIAPGYWLVLLLGIYYTICSVGEILLQGRLQANISGHARATITSMANMGMNIFGVLIYLFAGTTAQLSNWASAFAAAGVLTVVLTLAFYPAGLRLHKTPAPSED